MTSIDLGYQATIPEALKHSVERHGDTDFVVSLDRRMTYREVEEASAKLARRMLARGIGKGTRVGIFESYTHEFIVTWLAATRIGALVEGFSTIYSPAELGRVIFLGDIDVLITSRTVVGKDVEEFLERALPGLTDASEPTLRLTEAPYLRRVWIHGTTTRPWSESFDLYADPAPGDPDRELLELVEQQVKPGDAAVVVYTSGSSADPKGVVHSHGSVLRDCATVPAMMAADAHGLPAKAICGMPFFWVGGVLTIATALLSPLTLLIMPKFNAGEALELLERERGTSVIGWPTVMQSIRAHPGFATRDLSSAPAVTSGPADVATANVPIPGLSAHRSMSETMGTFADVELKVIDPETGLTVASGEEGELCVRGPGLMLGYYGRERWEILDADGWYHSADRVVMIEGDPRPFYVGRYSELIKASGANVSPREVEVAIEAHESVLHCLVFGTVHPQRGEEVTAVVVAAPGTEPTTETLAEYAAGKLSKYKVPTSWFLMDTDEIPWLGSGKPDKRRLRTLIESRVDA
ncbi:class I adenylate-forming enzyme family protein [Williamsia soli]|uniref:class I adenylate-forming enzyme family protein n=1 Tax=Williamsia soli TaxID=364929 RepID=UPI001A9F0B03|nr:class I adenylate-forming enzyme family protein [Williamsia soli]